TTRRSSSLFSKSYGNVLTLNTWTFIRGEAKTINTEIDVKIADLKIEDISHNKTGAIQVGETVVYTVKVKNGEPGDGNSDITGAPFTFVPPLGFVPDEDGTIQFASDCGAGGTEAVVVTYNPATKRYESTLNLNNGCEVTYIFPVKVTSDVASGSNIAEIGRASCRERGW